LGSVLDALSKRPFTAVWAIASGGGEPSKICAGEWVVSNPNGTLIVKRNESSRTNLFEVPIAGGPERPIPLEAALPLFGFFVLPGTIRHDGQMLVSPNVADSWFNPLAQLDLKSGRITRLGGEGVSDLHSGWTHDDGITARRMGLVSQARNIHRHFRDHFVMTLTICYPRF
jgi:hypothetical protein